METYAYMLHKIACLRTATAGSFHMLLSRLGQLIQLSLSAVIARPAPVAYAVIFSVASESFRCATLTDRDPGTARHDKRAIERFAVLCVVTHAATLANADRGTNFWMGLAGADRSPVMNHPRQKALIARYTEWYLVREKLV
jgi:hypothetical protein